MKTMKIRPMVALAVVSAGLIAATAAMGETGIHGTVNAVSDSEIARAKTTILHAGYQPEALAMAQDHYLFFNATKEGEIYEITVTPDKKLYVGTGLPAIPRS